MNRFPSKCKRSGPGTIIITSTHNLPKLHTYLPGLASFEEDVMFNRMTYRQDVLHHITVNSAPSVLPVEEVYRALIDNSRR